MPLQNPETKTVSFKDTISSTYTIARSISPFHMNRYHFHDYFEIYFSCCSGANFFINDQIYPIENHSLFLFNDKDLHRAVTNDIPLYDRYVLHFYPVEILPFCTDKTDLLACFQQLEKNTVLSEKQSKKLTALLEQAISVSPSSHYGDDIRFHLLLCEILLFINEIFLLPSQPTVSKDKNYSRIHEITGYIDEQITTPLTLDALANNFYLSKYHLGCIFKEATGFTVNSYIIQKRLLLAKNYLQEGYSVTETCLMSGFSDYSHFIRTFTEKIGLSPGRYKKQFIAKP